MMEYWLDQLVISALVTPMYGQDICKVILRGNLQHVDIPTWDHTSDKVEFYDVVSLL